MFLLLHAAGGEKAGTYGVEGGTLLATTERGENDVAREDGYFKPDDPRRAKGGRPKKPEWLKGKGEEALKKAYEIMTSEDTKPDLALQAAKLLIEYDIGKPVQALDINADVEANTNVSMIETMSLSKRGAAMKKALEIYEKDQQKAK